MQHATGWDALAAYLRTPAGAEDILDAAIVGAPLELDEILDDFGIAPGEFHRKMLWREINAALLDEQAA